MVLLVGGTGHGLFPLTDSIAKPMLHVGNRPLVSFQLEFLEAAGFEGESRRVCVAYAPCIARRRRLTRAHAAPRPQRCLW